MNWVKGFALATCLAAPLSVIVATAADAETKPAELASPAKAVAAEPKAANCDTSFNKAALKVLRDECSRQADAKGLVGSKGKSEERKKFRRGCLKDLGVASKGD